MDAMENVKFSQEQLKTLEDKRIAVIGCGGLGGYVLEMLARFGVGEILIVDDDVFDKDNLGRQVMSNQMSLGKYKVNEAVLWIKQVNPFIYVKGRIQRLTDDNALDILKGMDIVMDCVDNVETKFVLQSACEKLSIPLIHGAVENWEGQVSTIYPKDRTLDKIYHSDEMKTMAIKNSSLMPATVASYQVAECVKVLLDVGKTLRHTLMHINMLTNQSDKVDLK